MNTVKEVISNSPEETILSGKEFASNIINGDIVGLFGNLGSGKTQFVKGVCEYFKVRDPVNSPTFIIVNAYETNGDNSIKKVNHFDLYRLKNINELMGIGIQSYINDDSICIIEWAELADEYFKGNIKKIYFEHGEDENKRIIKFTN